MADRSVLLVEDDEALRTIIARHLRARGWAVHEAPSAEEAGAALARGHRPDVVILDINLPGDTGWDLLRGGPLADPGRPPVVVATATPISPRRLREFGVAGYLPKPFPMEALVSTLERLAGGSPELDRVPAPEGDEPT